MKGTFHTIETIVEGEKLLLLSQKAIYWEAQKALLIADLHLGKGKHFRKNGIAIPASSHLPNWKKLKDLLQIEPLERVLFLGDLFHSNYNADFLLLEELIRKHPAIHFELIMGNHDILEIDQYVKMGMKVHTKDLRIGPFLLSHEPLEEDSEAYNLAGHIHPGVRMKGQGRQSMKAACFYFGKKGGLLPAFGSLTGLQTISVNKNDQVYLIIEDEVIPAQ